MIGPTLDPAAFAVFTQTLRLLRDAMHEPFSLWMKWTFDFFRAGPRRAFGTTREMFRDRIEHQLPHVTARTLVIRGGIDPTVPQSAAIAAARLLPKSELLVIDGEPHCVHYTAPLAVWRAIERHVTPGTDTAQIEP
jgi:pimeloyl-ACP methyl ester carboxylesterase